MSFIPSTTKHIHPAAHDSSWLIFISWDSHPVILMVFAAACRESRCGAGVEEVDQSDMMGT